MPLLYMRRPDFRIRVQLTVSVCLFTLVCLVSLAVAIYTLSRNTLLRLERGNLDLNSRMLREECRQEFEDDFDSMYRLSYSSPVQHIFNNNADPKIVLDAANLLHNSFGPDRILLMKLYLSNGTEILEVDSRTFQNRSGIPASLLPLTNPESNVTDIMTRIFAKGGEFDGPLRAAEPISDTNYLMSLTLPIRYGLSDSITTPIHATSDTVGYATFLLNCLKLQGILSSVSLSSASTEVGTAALCAANDDLTEFVQLIPLNANITPIVSDLYRRKHPKVKVRIKNIDTSKMMHTSQKSKNISVMDGGNFPIPSVMAASLRHNLQPTAQVNKGPQKSMISISQFGILNANYYVVVLQSHRGVFSMTHHLRNIIILSSCVIGAGMIIFTFLFVSFGARQILRLKMAATYEQPAPTRWKFLPLPWWLRPVNRKLGPNDSDNSAFRVPEKVPLRKHVRDELDDITERFNIMSNELRKQYALLEDRVEVRKAEIEQAREAADIANAAKSHFLARVTHELRTPLNGIIGTATLCLEEDNIQQIHQSLRTIFKCGELLLHLMTDLLSFSQNEVENLDLEPRDFSLNEITSQLTAIFTEQCAGKQIQLVVDSKPENNKFVFSGDTNRILQVIFNLMSNGIKFTPDGGEVYFKAEISDNFEDPNCKNVTFYVKDNGPGIAPEMQLRVFEAFVQGDISSQVKKAGVGLGLSICRQLADRMHGTISLTSALGKGSTFIFQIPLKYHLFDTASSAFGQDTLDASSTASIVKAFNNNSASLGSPLGTPLQNVEEGELDQCLSSESRDTQTSLKCTNLQADLFEKDSMKTSMARAVLTRTLSSTSSRTRGFLGTRKKTQDSAFRPMDFLKRRRSSEIDSFHANSMKTTGNENENLEQSPRRTSISATYTGFSDSAPRIPSVPQIPLLSSKPLAEFPFPPQPLNSSKPTAEAGSSMVSRKNSSGLLFVSPDLHTMPHTIPDLPTLKADAPIKAFTERLPSNLKVLVVDDNSVNQEVMMRMLNLEGLKSIIVANDGLQAIEKIKEADEIGQGFDVIFMDVQMPNMDGRQATRIIRQEMKKTLPVVAVSAFANEKNADDCIEAGMDLFLSKPLRRPHLREILRSLSSLRVPTTSPNDENQKPGSSEDLNESCEHGEKVQSL